MSEVTLNWNQSTLKSFPWATYGRAESNAEFWQKIDDQRNRVSLFKRRSLISLIIWVDEEVTPADLERTLDGLCLQSYPHWEAIVVGQTQNLSQSTAKRVHDGRIKWKRINHHLNRVERKREATHYAEGEWVAFLRAGTILSPAAFYDFMVAAETGDVEFLYCNTVQLSSTPSFISRNEFSWFTLLHFNYIGDFWLVRRALYDAVGGLPVSCYPSEDHAFLIKLSELTQRWKLVPAYYVYSNTENSVSNDSLIPALKDHLSRRELMAEVQIRESRVSIEPLILKPETDLVSVVICFKDKVDWTMECLKRLKEQKGKVKVEVILVNNNSKSEEAEKLREFLYREFPASDSLASSSLVVKWVDYESPFNFGNMHNVAIRKHAQGNYILVLNNDVFWSGTNNLDKLVAWAQFDWVGTVGFLLKYQHGGIQHSGFSARFGGEARLVRLGNASGYDRYAKENHEVFGNTFAACLFKRSTYDAIGGFRELDIPNGFGDVSFNFECINRGWHNLYLGQIEGVHLESASRGLSYEYWEECIIEREYPQILAKMLRQDLGVNRIPKDDYRVSYLLGEAFKAKIRRSAPWLKPWKDRARKIKNEWSLRLTRSNT